MLLAGQEHVATAPFASPPSPPPHYTPEGSLLHPSSLSPSQTHAG